MAPRSFDINAQLTISKVVNVKSVANSIKQKFESTPINVNINFKMPTGTDKRVGNLTNNLRALDTALKSVATNATKVESVLKNLANISTTVTKNTTAIAQGADKVSKSANTAAKATEKLTDEFAEFGRISGLAVRRFAGFTIATGAVFGFVNAVRQGIDAAIEFETQLTKVAQVTGAGTAKSLRGLNNEITRLSTGLGVSSKALSEVSLILAQAGLSATDTKKALDVLAKTTLAPTFTDIKNTAEGSIAALNQFELQVEDLDSALGSINAVASRFAVESDDIVSAIRRSGGVFAEANRGIRSNIQSFQEFISVFASVRQRTRESAESIATGLRTIITRLQRRSTINFLEGLGIQLTDIQGKFVGPTEAVKRLGAALKDADTLKISAITEELGGFRQVGKTIPLIKEAVSETGKLNDILRVAAQGAGSLAEDAAIAQQTLAVRIAKTREEFLALVRDFSQTDTFQAFANTTLLIADSLIKLGGAIKPVLPILGLFAAFKGASVAARFATGFTRGLAPGGAKDVGENVASVLSGKKADRAKADLDQNTNALKTNTTALTELTRAVNKLASRPVKLNSGGLVPGIGNTDSVPASLTPGEFVIRKKAVQAIGADNLASMNRFAAGGNVDLSNIRLTKRGKAHGNVGRKLQFLQQKKDLYEAAEIAGLLSESELRELQELRARLASVARGRNPRFSSWLFAGAPKTGSPRLGKKKRGAFAKGGRVRFQGGGEGQEKEFYTASDLRNLIKQGVVSESELSEVALGSEFGGTAAGQRFAQNFKLSQISGKTSVASPAIAKFLNKRISEQRKAGAKISDVEKAVTTLGVSIGTASSPAIGAFVFKEGKSGGKEPLKIESLSAIQSIFKSLQPRKNFKSFGIDDAGDIKSVKAYVDTRFVNQNVAQNVNDTMRAAVEPIVHATAQGLFNSSNNKPLATLLDRKAVTAMDGYLFEGAIRSGAGSRIADFNRSPLFDFVGDDLATVKGSNLFGDVPASVIAAEAKRKQEAIGTIREKITKSLTGEQSAKSPTRQLLLNSINVQRLNSGGEADSIPALLTPGEFVINRKAAARIGRSRLERMNNADKIGGFNSGGAVGRVRMADGGFIENPSGFSFQDATAPALLNQLLVDYMLTPIEENLSNLNIGSIVEPLDEQLTQLTNTTRQANIVLADLNDTYFEQEKVLGKTVPANELIRISKNTSGQTSSNIGNQNEVVRIIEKVTGRKISESVQESIADVGKRQQQSPIITSSVADPQSPIISTVDGPKNTTTTLNPVIPNNNSPIVGFQSPVQIRKRSNLSPLVPSVATTSGVTSRGDFVDPLTGQYIPGDVTARRLPPTNPDLTRFPLLQTPGVDTGVIPPEFRGPTVTFPSTRKKLFDTAESRLQTYFDESASFAALKTGNTDDKTQRQARRDLTRVIYRNIRELEKDLAPTKALTRAKQTAAKIIEQNAKQQTPGLLRRIGGLPGSAIRGVSGYSTRLQQRLEKRGLAGFGGAFGLQTAAGLVGGLSAGITDPTARTNIGRVQGGLSGAGALLGLGVTNPLALAGGAIVGGVVAGRQANIDAQLQQAQVALNDSTNTLDDVFNKLANSAKLTNDEFKNLVSELDKAIEAQAEAATLQVQANAAQRAGAFRTGIGGIDDVGLSNIFGIGLNSIVGGLGKAIQEEGFLFSSSRVLQEAQGIATPLFTKQLELQERLANRSFIAAFEPNIRASETIIQRRLNRGGNELSTEELLTGLGADTRFGLLLRAEDKNLNKTQIRKRIESAEDEAAERAKIADEYSAVVDIVLGKMREETEKRAVLNNALVRQANELDTLTNVFQNIGALASRISFEGSDINRQRQFLQARLGGSTVINRVSRRGEAALTNIRGFAPDEIEAELQILNRRLGNNAASNQLIESVRVAKAIQTFLPDILNEAITTDLFVASTKDDKRLKLKEAVGQQVIGSLQARGFNVPEPIIKQIFTGLDEAIDKREDQLSEDTIQQDISKVLRDLAPTIVEEARKAGVDIAKVINDVYDNVIAETEQYIQAQKNINAQVFSLAKLEANNVSARAQLAGRELSINERLGLINRPRQAFSSFSLLSATNPFMGQQSRISRQVTGPQDIADAIRSLRKEEENLNRRIEAERGIGGEDTAAFAELQKQLRENANQQNRMTTALNDLATDTRALAEIQSELKRIEEGKKAGQNFIERLAFASPEERVKLNLAAQRGQTLLGGQNPLNLFGVELREAVEAARSAVEVSRATDKISDEVARGFLQNINRAVQDTVGIRGTQLVDLLGLNLGFDEDPRVQDLRRRGGAAIDLQEEAVRRQIELQKEALAPLTQEIAKVLDKQFGLLIDEMKIIARQVPVNKPPQPNQPAGVEPKNKGGIVGFANGGRIPGTGPDKDTVLVAGTTGEYIIPRRQTKKYLPLLKAIHNDNVPGFQNGGILGASLGYHERGTGGFRPHPDDIFDITREQVDTVNISDASLDKLSRIFTSSIDTQTTDLSQSFKNIKPIVRLAGDIQSRESDEWKSVLTNFEAKNSGGYIPGGGPNRDTVPAMLTRGEFVVNRNATQSNLPLLQAINSGGFLGFQAGGEVPRFSGVNDPAFKALPQIEKDALIIKYANQLPSKVVAAALSRRDEKNRSDIFRKRQLLTRGPNAFSRFDPFTSELAETATFQPEIAPQQFQAAVGRADIPIRGITDPRIKALSQKERDSLILAEDNPLGVSQNIIALAQARQDARVKAKASNLKQRDRVRRFRPTGVLGPGGFSPEDSQRILAERRAAAIAGVRGNIATAGDRRLEAVGGVRLRAMGVKPRGKLTLPSESFANARSFLGNVGSGISSTGSFLFGALQRAANKQNDIDGIIDILNRRGRRRTGFQTGGAVGRPATSGTGGSGSLNTFVSALNQFKAELPQQAQQFLQASNQMAKAAEMLSNVHIPEKIEMKGTHTVQIVLNGADVLSNMQDSLRQLVMDEINKGIRQHINPVTGETFEGSVNA